MVLCKKGDDITIRQYINKVSYSDTSIHRYRYMFKNELHHFLVKQFFSSFLFHFDFLLHFAYFPFIFASDFFLVKQFFRSFQFRFDFLASFHLFPFRFCFFTSLPFAKQANHTLFCFQAKQNSRINFNFCFRSKRGRTLIYTVQRGS